MVVKGTRESRKGIGLHHHLDRPLANEVERQDSLVSTGEGPKRGKSHCSCPCIVAAARGGSSTHFITLTSQRGAILVRERSGYGLF